MRGFNALDLHTITVTGRDGARKVLLWPRAVAGVTAAVGWEQPLLDRIMAGDSEALLDLYDRVGWFVCSRARRITNERLVAEMITVGIFTLVWRCPQDFSADRLQHSLQLLADQRATKWIYE